MSVVMRLRRMGGNQRPFYRLVVADSRNPREGRFLERLGDYNPMVQKDKVKLKPDRIVHWLGQGAVPSQRVSQLLRSQGIRPTAPKTAVAKAVIASGEKAAKEVKAAKKVKA